MNLISVAAMPIHCGEGSHACGCHHVGLISLASWATLCRETETFQVLVYNAWIVVLCFYIAKWGL